MKIAAIIPARYESSRLPGKPLADLHGEPMIVHVVKRVASHPALDLVLVATDDMGVAAAVAASGHKAVMTRSDHASGTDRVAQIAADLDVDLIVNVQGDEPLFEPRMLDDALAPFHKDKRLKFGTVCAALDSDSEIFDPNCVKVVVNDKGFALYFSRAPIPFAREEFNVNKKRYSLRRGTSRPPMFKHLGLYVYRRDFLLDFAGWAPSSLEQIERLEQLRALQRGVRIACPITRHGTISVDTPEDLEAVRRLMAEKKQ